MDSNVKPDEIVSRFILTKKSIKPSTNTIRHNAFMPSMHYNATSVFRIDDLSEDEIWKIGNTYVAEPQGKNIYARGDLQVFDILNVDKLVVVGKEPPERHELINNWPDLNQREEVLALAKELALIAGEPVKIS